MSAYRKSKKLIEAIRILCDEGFSDTGEDAWHKALETRKITTETIYRAMNVYGMKWDHIRGTWYTRACRTALVKTLFTTVKKIDRAMLKEQGIL